MSYEKIILVTRKTRLEGLVERFNTRAQARFYIDQAARHVQQTRNQEANPAFAYYEEEHNTYHAAVDRLRESLQQIAKVQVVERGFLPNFLFGKTDLVVCIGIDGLVVNTAKYLNGQLIVAVNPDPDHVDGILLPFDVTTAPNAIEKAMEGKGRTTSITMAEAHLNDGRRLLAFNDLFIGAQTHISARYRIQWSGTQEEHSSSGLIVSTGVGATGWLSSMFNMANGMFQVFGGPTMGSALHPPPREWSSENLLFVVREPFVSKTSGASIVCGSITAQTPMVVESRMPEQGVIFSDGVEADFLQFNSGAVATIGIAEKRTCLLLP